MFDSLSCEGISSLAVIARLEIGIALIFHGLYYAKRQAIFAQGCRYNHRTSLEKNNIAELRWEWGVFISSILNIKGPCVY